MTGDRVLDRTLAGRVVSAAEAAARIGPGETIALSGFAGVGRPKVVPAALVAVQEWPVGVDVRHSRVAQHAASGFYGALDVAVVEVAAILPNGLLVPGSSVGNNQTWLDLADKVILEVNGWHPRGFEGFHDIHHGAQVAPLRAPIQLTTPMQRIGDPYLLVDPAKIVAVVETDLPDTGQPLSPIDEESREMAELVVDFLRHEVRHERLHHSLLPLHVGEGDVTDAVLAGLRTAEFEHMTAYTANIRDGHLDLLDCGKLIGASATSFRLSAEGARRVDSDVHHYKGRILLRTQEIANHPEVIRRLGLIAIDSMLEADLHGNVSAVDGSGDFARNAHLNIFVGSSTTGPGGSGAASRIVPNVSRVDHTGHDVQVMVTEQGVADLRGLSPAARARRIIDRCAHPDFRDQLAE
ncbi:acetyl-CoA hydrolase/transferase C-terminal domain-containing protein [Nocardioides albus]|uniref:Succinyl-CoA:acetate CoA-transferase n=1 Tax=Nocardioides albus TaxID=1841 RepID=A0A7W5A9M9_9ACTN|nr:acetyl-CoA hydrolase/transferase C-terminal domain-containing protein [Nocardioides albus]MBB3092266.1 succinyl-CoA:acetate CoA-transferase [Nocardioides albus]GGU11635.1 acetyl-CoA hydrolase/transferase [Nocardioides albus]